MHGLSKPPEDINMLKLKTVIQEYSGTVAISSISLWEILLHYRNRAKSIRRLSTFMRCNHIRIYNDRYIAVPNGEKYDFTQIRQKELKQFISQIMPRKIYVESHFACVVYLLTIFAITYFDVFPQTASANDNIFQLLSSVFSVERDLSVRFFEEIYTNGYQTDDCENYVRGAFQQILQLTIPSTISLLKELADITEDEDLKTRLNNMSREKWNNETLKIAKAIKKRFLQRNILQNTHYLMGKQLTINSLQIFLITCGQPLAVCVLSTIPSRNISLPLLRTSYCMEVHFGKMILTTHSFWAVSRIKI